MTDEPTPGAKRIGQLNGPWSMMFRVALLTYPLLLVWLAAWTIWVTANIFSLIAFRDSGERFTKTDGAALEARVVEKISAISERAVRIEAKLDKNP